MKPKILYVSPIWTGLANYELGDHNESGMPAFSEPIKLMIEQGIDVRVLWLADEKSAILKDRFFDSQKKVTLRITGKASLAFAFLKIFFKSLIEIIRLKPDTVFCHGAISAGAIIAAAICHRKTVVRVYGTNKYAQELERLGRAKFFLRYPFIYCLFAIPTDTLIATNDGSNADQIYRCIGRAKEFYFLRNGRPSSEVLVAKRRPTFLCVGRIEEKKNQIAALRFFEDVFASRQGAKLLFVGPVSDVEYNEKLQAEIKISRNCEDITSVGALPKQQLYDLYRQSEALLSFQKNSNFGNTCIEALTFECLVITLSEPAFSELEALAGSPGALAGYDPTAIAEKFIELPDDEVSRIRRSGRLAITKMLRDWRQRALEEVDIVAGRKRVK